MNIDEEKNKHLIEEYEAFEIMLDKRSRLIHAQDDDGPVGKFNFKAKMLRVAKALAPVLDYLGLPSHQKAGLLLTDALTDASNKSEKVAQAALEKLTGKFFGRSFRMPTGYMSYVQLTKYYSNILGYLLKTPNILMAELKGENNSAMGRAIQLQLHFTILRNLLKFELPFLLLDTDTHDLLEYVDIQPIHFDSIHLPFPATTVVFAEDHALPFDYSSPVLNDMIKIRAITIGKAVVVRDKEATPTLVINMMHNHMHNGCVAFNYHIGANNDGFISTAGVVSAVDGMARNNGHLVEFVLKLLLIMHHKPECVVQESEPRPLVGVRRGVSYIPKQFILPKMVYKNNKGDVLDESQVIRKKMRRHPVRGHTRQQPYGEGRSLVKEKYIAPYWKCEDNEN